jgi:hypothetical protein
MAISSDYLLISTCTTNHRRADTSKYLEMIGAHDTRPHKIGEPVRWRNVSTVDSSGKTILAFNLEFDCSQIAEVCVSAPGAPLDAHR